MRERKKFPSYEQIVHSIATHLNESEIVAVVGKKEVCRHIGKIQIFKEAIRESEVKASPPEEDPETRKLIHSLFPDNFDLTMEDNGDRMRHYNPHQSATLEYDPGKVRTFRYLSSDREPYDPEVASVLGRPGLLLCQIVDRARPYPECIYSESATLHY